MSDSTPERRPNVVLVLADDMGFSDLGCFGGEIATPNLDRLAACGVRMSQFYNTARCSPSRASLLTGLHPHQTGVGILNGDDRPEGYAGTLNDRCATLAETLGRSGYRTYMSGKWHLSARLREPCEEWPTRRGFDHFFGTIAGSGSYWTPMSLTRDMTNIEGEAWSEGFHYTDAISENAAAFIAEHQDAHAGEPFFCYVTYTAPHWPLHAPEEDVAAYHGRYDRGWDRLRSERLDRLRQLGILDPAWECSERDPAVRPWESVEARAWQARRMEVYAAQVERMDAGIGRIVAALETAGQLDNTVLVFLSDNGGCAEELRPFWVDEVDPPPRQLPVRTRDGRRVFRGNTPESWPGGEDTYASYGRGWANLSNAPFREFKHWVHEGGIATPFIVHWPGGGLEPGAIRHAPHQLPDVAATVLDVTGVEYPTELDGRPLEPLEGVSMLPTWHGAATGEDRTLCWEHEGNAAIRRGPWKLVRKYPGDWELYQIRPDRTELRDRAGEHAEVVADLDQAYAAWANRCGVIPRAHVLDLYRRRGRTPDPNLL